MPFQPNELTESTFKGFVDRLHRFAKESPQSAWPPRRTWAQEALARALGFQDYHAAHTALSKTAPSTSGFVWSLSLSGGVADLSESLAQGAQPGHPLRLTTEQLSSHLVLVATESTRAQAVASLCSQAVSAQTPVLLVQGPLSFSDRVLPKETSTPISPSSDRQVDPFLVAPAPELIQYIVDMMDEATSDAALWKSRAITLASSVIPALVWLRDNTGLSISPNSLREALFFQSVIMLADDNRIPQDVREPLDRYLLSVPGFVRGKTSQSPTAQEQHGFLEMQFSGLLNRLRPFNSPQPYMSVLLSHMDQGSAEPKFVEILGWLDRYPGGVLVFDGLSPTSPAYPWLLRHMGKFAANRCALVVGVRALSDLPPQEMTDRILDRILNWIVSPSVPSWRRDARHLRDLQR